MSIKTFIREITEAVQPLHLAHTQAIWHAATSGTTEAIQAEAEAQANLMRFWSNPSRFLLAKDLCASAADADPLTARAVKIIYLAAAKAQQDEDTIQKITRLEAQVRLHYYNFRARVGDSELSDNQLDSILRQSSDSDEVQQAWTACKQIGGQVADQLRELARVRNAAARAQGYRDHVQRSLELNEIDETQLLKLLSDLEQDTRDLFKEVKAKIDERRAAHFHIRPQDLRPWHFGDRFFQDPPPSDELDLDPFFADYDPVDLATRTYEGLGLEVRGILQRSDLYPRPGKNQHAFSLDIDRCGDVRTLNNLEPSHRWTETLLHELGHASYSKHIDRSLPWLLRRSPHTLSTEAVALNMGSLTYDRDWLRQILAVEGRQADAIAATARAQERALKLIFTRWCLVMIHFERALYADPEADLDSLWWDLAEKYQDLRRPEGRRAPDWACKYHVALEPVYYQNYLLGYLVGAQIGECLRQHFGGLVENHQAGQWLVESIFRPGASLDWASHVRAATGEPLDSRHFMEPLRQE